MTKLNGYRPSHKNKWRLIEGGILSVQELALLEYYADIFDFDKKHEKYGLFEEDFTQTPIIFDCSSGTIRNWHKKLLSLGFIHETSKKHIYLLACPDRYINPGIWGGKASNYQKVEKDQNIEIILQSFEIDFQSIKEKLQQNKKSSTDKSDSKTKTDSIAIGSSKDGLGILKSNSEYEQIKKEGQFPNLTIEDMKWIDQKVIEDPNVTS
jgi:hypothetical protein